ncbi:MAG: AraC family transcriptional regulator [Tannerellaceae bacterium]|nr:AraC family transcriptional regulator [Tannerellaceae bacterium]
MEAKALLKSTNFTIQQISDQLNFPTQSYFGRYFKKNTGMSPKSNTGINNKLFFPQKKDLSENMTSFEE